MPASRELRETNLTVIRGGPIDPARLRRLLIRLGPMFVKIGQFLALRPDVLPQEYCDELLQLVDQAEPEPWENIRTTLVRELGAPPEEIFKSIRTKALAAGSIAQVHRATLHDGTRVVVKVQRTNLEERVKKDLRRVRWLARALDWSGVSPFTSPEEVVEELDRWLHQELDFTRELRSQQRMFDEMKSEPIVRVARPYVEYSTAKVVTSEYLPGLPFSRVMQILRESGPRALERLGIDSNILAEDLIETALHQIFRLRFFHADLHPGNLIAMRGNVIGLVDFGLTDVLDPSVERRQADFLSSIYGEDVTGMYRAVSQVFIEGPDTNAEAFRRDFFNETSRWLAEKNDARDVTSRSPTAGYMVSVMRLARVHDMRLPTSVLSLYRSLLTAESVAYQLQSGATLGGVGQGFFRGLQIEKTLETFEPGRLIAWLMQINDLVRSGPGNFQQVLSDVADGRFILPVRTLDSEQSRRVGNQRTRLLTLSIVFLGLSLLIAMPARKLALFGVSLEPLLWAGLAIDFVAMFVLWRKLE
ncbi:MAG TPA: AarF/ABC1/UbiB kinase family protein [Thermoanaerobaculia bacterium]